MGEKVEKIIDADSSQTETATSEKLVNTDEIPGVLEFYVEE
jgi:predicted peroxiredoxin